MPLDHAGVQRKNVGGYFAPQLKDTLIRFLPRDLEYFSKPVSEVAFAIYRHYRLGPAHNLNCVCPKTFNLVAPCPACELSDTLRVSTIVADKAVSRDLFRKIRHLLNVMDLSSSESIARGVQAYECGFNVYSALIRTCVPGFGDVLDIETGRNFHLYKDQQGNMPNYSCMPDGAPSSVKDKLPTNFMEQIAALHSLIPLAPTYEEIKKMMEGEVDTLTPIPPAPAAIPPAPAAAIPLAPAAAIPPAASSVPAACPHGRGTVGIDFSMKNPICTTCEIREQCKQIYLS